MSRLRRLLVPVAVAGVAAGAVAAPASAAPAPSCDTTSTSYSYVVLYQPGEKQRSVDAELTAKCGKRIAYYPEIGVAVASSRNADFADRLGVKRAYSAGKDVAAKAAARAGLRSAIGMLERTESVAAGADLSTQQWDMRAIHAPEANKINPGSRSVTVGVLDSGIDAKHPALAHAVDTQSSTGCVTGAPDASAWAPTTSDHGTHVAGTIAGKDPARGFTGIAPGVRVASVKVVSDAGYIFPEAAVCGFVWAAQHGFQLTNSSYFIDPGMFYCRNEAGDAAAYEAVRRAVTYSTQRGTLNVAAAGNSGFDVRTQTVDPIRPHKIDSSCGILPKAIDGVVAVSAVGYAGTKSSYSNYGAITVTAPGGDSAQLPPSGQGGGCTLSTVFHGAYGTKCGTSMASPHVAGVAALLASTHRNATPGALTALLTAEADPVACDASACSGSARNNSYYGRGLVNALDAVH